MPGVRLDPDLLRRSWYLADWRDHGAVIRRVLPQLAEALTDRGSESYRYGREIGAALARADWPQWPAQQAAAVREFLHAYWIHALLGPEPVDPGGALALCVEASGVLAPWLADWAALDHPVVDAHLEEAVDQWDYDLLVDKLPWLTDHDERTEEALATELAAWFTRHAPARLKARQVPDDLLQRLRLFGLPGPARYSDPHWPGYTY
ncbi:hypothetical protein CFP65_1100 [Kitasatospora sp. MMS16-BH015]|uniref:hypothetical protein n=1 Tax=Kitasatospora sp. MMS16-BH015 TaxID=2018025 RepID=UPI000CA24814|nr:hypothetical protein [Kitasatospora sp. MMS16-BH015]AUG76015.1 hypothetical protein CFP65_1100 [Kitasatospora sp. MMS16-BH015]